MDAVFIKFTKSDIKIQFCVPTIRQFTSKLDEMDSVLLGVSMATLSHININRYWTYALWLALFTISYNLAEGLISIFFGISDEALTLFGFGVDSFIEVMSGIGILAMVIRIRQNPDAPRTQFERAALRVTGTAFYLLVVGLCHNGRLQYCCGAQTRNDLARSRHLGYFDSRHVGACSWQAQGGTRAQLPADPLRRKLHDGLHLHVGRFAGFQFDL
ncbi:MAG: hypothetical protein MZV70_21700 [Desulfobacterales bacterium]|nr:hypothetical protein [Desulfobacterales bacterium]